MDERERFWTELGARLSAIAAKHPRLNAAEVIKIKTSIERHVPAPTRAEHHLQFPGASRAPAKSVEKRQVRSVSVEA
jgi:hypothetical protein